jgi:thiol:disulfide interchange protein
MTRIFFTTILLLLAVRPLLAQSSTRPEVLDPVLVKTDLYPANADANKEIDQALKKSAAEHKRVILIFGANWCYDCHVLDRALHEGEAGKIVKENFILVHVDIGEADKNLELVKKYKIPLDKGVPAVAILEADGSEIYSSGEGEFEAARRMMKKDLLAFLNRWKRSGANSDAPTPLLPPDTIPYGPVRRIANAVRPLAR